MSSEKLFHGIVVVIDDEIEDEKSEIHAIQTQIEGAGCSVVGMKDIPESAKLENLRAASFFVVDWNLAAVPLGEGVGAGAGPVPERVKRDNAKKMTTFLQDLRKYDSRLYSFSRPRTSTKLRARSRLKQIYMTTRSHLTSL